MKKLLMIATMVSAMAVSGSIFAKDVKDAKAAQLGAEIAQLQDQLSKKEAEYNEYIKSLDLEHAETDVKLRGGKYSRCDYQCSSRHSDDWRMRSKCVNACMGW